MKTVLITGGAGFIGSHLCDFFLAQKFKVICVDNFVTGSKLNIGHHLQNPLFSFIEHDVSKPFIVKESVDYVLHFACPASPIDYQKIPLETLHVCSMGTFHILELARQKKAVFLLASTSEVYGDPAITPQPETYWGNVNSIGPRSCYDEGKRYAEAEVMAYHRVYNLNTKIVRIFNTYGPRMRKNDGRVVPAFVTEALHNESLTIFGDGTQTRSFCYVDDLIQGIYSLLLSSLHDPVNIGNPHEFTMNQLAEQVLILTQSKSTIIYCPLPVDDPKQRKPDITKARTLLGWEPKIQLNEGLKKTIAWFRE
ncbi:MAG: UDP-glucuronic acid decarboxylase family protein [Candidatus Woesearchaeota archaeon]|jgi:dTDP-glucose 4,6-dehydratase